MYNLLKLQKAPDCEDYESSPLRRDSTFLQPRTLRASDLELEKELSKRRKYAIGTISATGFILSGLIVTCMVAPITSNSSFSADGYDDCDTSSPSLFQSFIKLNIPLFRGMGFSETKFLDVAVDLMLGQGGRALHGWVAYMTFSDAFTGMVESIPVTYDLYIAVKFNPTSITGLISFFKGLKSVTTIRFRFLMGWFVCATIYVLIFPTLFGASTGYYSPSRPVYQVTGSSTLVTRGGYQDFFDNSANACFQIQNGPLIGLSEDLLLEPKEFISNKMYTNKIEYGKTAPYPFVTGNTPNETSLWMNLTNYYYSTRHFTSLSNFSTDSVFWINSTNLGPDTTLLNFTSEACWNNTIITDDFETLNHSCLQTDGYVYGLSLWLILTLLFLELIWVFGMFGVWWDAHRHSELNRRGWKRSGDIRSIVEVSEAIERDLGKGVSSYSEKELVTALKGKKLRYTMERGEDLEGVVRVGLSSDGLRERVRLEQGVLYR